MAAACAPNCACRNCASPAPSRNTSAASRPRSGKWRTASPAWPRMRGRSRRRKQWWPRKPAAPGLSEQRYRAGVEGRLELLDAQRQLYAARQELLTLRREEIGNAIALYKALGG